MDLESTGLKEQSKGLSKGLSKPNIYKEMDLERT